MWHTFGMSSESMTTIKVSKHLRERLSRNAGRAGLTAAALISELLDERERQARFEAVRRAYEDSADDAYAAETQEWDSLAGDGMAS
jgi:macrodomain Ter protein organizer (MatP/YcbG family)